MMSFSESSSSMVSRHPFSLASCCICLLASAASVTSRFVGLPVEQPIPKFSSGMEERHPEFLAPSSDGIIPFERAFMAVPARTVTLAGWNMVGTESSCDRYALINETQCLQKCEQAAKCELVTYGINKKTGFCCLHQLNERTLLGRPQQSRHWKIIYEEQPIMHRVEGQVFWGDKIRRFDVDQEEVCSLACTYDPNCNVAAFKKTRNVCFLMKNMDVPRNVYDPEYITFYTELQLKMA